MGNKPRGVSGERLIESLRNQNLHAVLNSTHDVFQAVEALGTPALGPPEPPLNSYSDNNILELLGHPANPSGSFGKNVLGKRTQGPQQSETAKKGWTGHGKLSAPPLWRFQHQEGQTKFSLPCLAGNGTISSPANVVPSSAEDRSCQPVWCDRKAGVGKTSPRKLQTGVKPGEALIAETHDPEDSPSPTGNTTSKDVADIDAKQLDSSDDCSEHNGDELEEKNPSNSPIGMGRAVSKNLVSERKRRKKLNEGLYTLRVLVPRISKMDKASIIGDAIDYMRELQKQVQDLQAGILDMESNNGAAIVGDEPPLAEQDGVQGAAPDDGTIKTSGIGSNPEFPSRLPDSDGTEQKILELDVAIMENQVYHLRIFCCTKGPGVFVQLMESLEALGLEVLNANLTAIQDNILNTFIAEIKDWDMMRTDEVKKAIMDVAARFGLQQS